VTGDVSDYVLQNIPPGQSEALDEAVQTAAAAVESIITAGLPAAMNKFNS
jgi:peptidyl-tRNA hydrolase